MTQVAATDSMRGHESDAGEPVSSAVRGVSELVFDGGGLRGVSGVDPMARGFCLSEMRRHKGLAYGSWAVALPRLSPTNLGDSRYAVPGQPQTAAVVVSCHVADDGAEDGAERTESV